MAAKDVASTLAEALALAQADMPAVEPNAVNPHFRSKFVSLDHLIAKTRPVLNLHGLSMTQWPSVSDIGQPTLTTRLTHTSGEFIENTMPLLLGKQDMQGLGGAITYARRYAWASALGISADEDDDGNQASAAAEPTAAAANGNGNNQSARPAGEPAASAAQQKKLDRLIVNLTTADPQHDWADVAEKVSLRDFGHSRDELGKVEIEQVVAQFEQHLEKLAVPA